MLVFLLAALLQSNPAPCSSPEYRQFDFWIGDWVVHNPQGQQIGTNRIEKVESGCGLQENWTSARGGTGRSLNSYRPSTGQWHQTWLGANGLLLLDGKFSDGKMVLEGTAPAPNGGQLLNRITWSPMDGGKVRQVWEQSTDGGKTWTTVFDGRYALKSAAKSGAR